MIHETEFDFDPEKFDTRENPLPKTSLKEGFLEGDLNPDFSSGFSASENGVGISGASEVVRAKSSLRLKYEAESEVIRRKLGDLEAIRSQLGLSQRKMAQLLLVDPSAWTRWTKGGEQVPPHVYRMLQWYLALEEKYPALDVNFWLSTVSQVTDQTRVPELEYQLQETQNQLAHLETRLQSQLMTQITAQIKIQADSFSSALETRLNSMTSSLNEGTFEALRLEMERKERSTRRFLTWIAASIFASSLGLGLIIYLVTL